ncbi:uncharacterized protein Dwil_GK17815 [Drosophila willistoni]|uniref:Peptidase S1 domain-containing protein n=2 Tax=Drosophila willistoni TaxID=7260 RepID=B4N630_DROWI|nr:uncharacterized protein Dwil_GK17815 [Drosophila willistoni]
MPHQFLLLLISTLLATIYTIDASPVFVDNPSLAQFQSGRNIRHLPCIVRKSGRSGVCMFAIDCIKQNGTHLGTCIDRFYFGSCCALKDEASLFAPEISDNSIDQNTISHFAHESTTLPTSALFKLTTEGSGSSSTTAKYSPQTASELLKNVTQSYLSTVKPIRTTHPTTRRPAASHTTHKNSHFVVRTTVKPNLGPLSTKATLTSSSTTVKPPRRRPTHSTTSNRPVLTTSQAVLEQRIETTTAPSKFVTFQIVETTTPQPTEATQHLVEATTTTNKRHHTKPTQSSRRTTSTTTTRGTTTTTTTTTTARPTPPLRTTSTSSTAKPHKTQSSRRPAPAKKPSTTTTGTSDSATPTTSGTRRPVESSSTTTAPPPPPLRDEVNNVPERATTSTTHAPRPRPQPTGEVVKVPALLAEPTPTTPTTTTTASKETTKVMPTTTTTTAKPTTITTEATKKATPSSTTTTRTTSTTTTTTTPATTTTRKSTTTTAATTTTAKPTRRHTTKPPTTTTTTTTRRPTTTIAPQLLTTTTAKPGLITWTDVEAEPMTNATITNDWQPAAPPTNWIAVNKTTSTTVAPTPSAPPSATDKVVISVATSVSTSQSKPGTGSSTTSKPHRTTKPPTTTSTSTTTPSTTTTTRTTTITTDAPLVNEISNSSSSVELASSTSSSSSAEQMGTTTTDYSGEELNTTIDATGSTTLAPTNALEGVDYKEVCGRRMFPEPRIVGGANAAFGRWPWQISLRQWRTSTYLHKCGAALLNENWAITAAHCVDNVPPSDLLLRLGEYDLAEEEEPYAYQERRVQIVASHPQFDPRTFEYDLALLRFYEPVVFQPNIIPVCVPENDENFIGQTAFVTGWGRLYEDGPLPSVLQEVAVPVINNTICESMYRTAGYIEHIPHIFICAGWKKGGYDSCEGDSGGPMVLQREADKRFQLGGVISWGIGCAEANQPGVYTRISEFRDWINQILQF